MKATRHAKILEMISKHEVETQEEILQMLREEGFNVTQATVSRDIKELHLIKSLNKDGTYSYSTFVAQQVTNNSDRFQSLFRNSVVSLDCAGYTVVIKCYTGMAQAVCASLDSLNWNSLVGTIAGDDTIFALVRTPEDAMSFMNELKKYL